MLSEHFACPWEAHPLKAGNGVKCLNYNIEDLLRILGGDAEWGNKWISQCYKVPVAVRDILRLNKRKNLLTVQLPKVVMGSHLKR